MTDRQSLTDLARERLRAEAEGHKNGADEARKLEAIRARDLCALPDPISEGIIGSLVIPGYRTAIGGATGEGKSVFVLHAIRAALTREDFLGIEPAGCD